MTETRQILTTQMSVAAFLLDTKGYCDKHIQDTSDNQRSDFTDLGEQAINNHIWKCYPSSSQMGKNHRDLNSSEASILLEKVKHIDDIHLITHYKKLPHNYLENTFITIVFSNYEEDEITERLQKALYIKSILKSTAKNGSIDALKQEVSFKKVLKKDKKISDYFNQSSKYPFVSFLGINFRTLQSFGGGRNEKK